MTQRVENNTPTETPHAPQTEKPDKTKASEREPFFKTLPGILTGIAAVLTAVGGLITGLASAGIIGLEAKDKLIAETGLYIVSTIPENHATGVDPELSEILVEFNGTLVADSYSLVISDLGITPEITGDPAFLDEFTCAIPVHLEPGTTYALGFNDAEHTNFKSADDENISAEPYVLIFSTK